MKVFSLIVNLLVLSPFLFDFTLSEKVWELEYLETGCIGLEFVAVSETNKCIYIGGSEPYVEWKCKGSTPSVCFSYDDACGGCSPDSFVDIDTCISDAEGSIDAQCQGDGQVPTQDERFGRALGVELYEGSYCSSSSSYFTSFFIGCQTTENLGIDSTSPYGYVFCNSSGVFVGECTDYYCDDCSVRVATNYDMYGTQDYSPAQLGVCTRGITLTCPVSHGSHISTIQSMAVLVVIFGLLLFTVV
eukprot:TRINITY_DN1019_c0_g1_i9.p1 TRINITY_DN1019_c0_g1~~TRINITY_DN1019_c0_g1_i9.p1  ORF type:complete len:245 (-),score=16.44 TRINITY_DN1019_c0_g1_i9:169-903(-)